MRLSSPLDCWFAEEAPKGDNSLSAAKGQIYLDQYKKSASDLNNFVHPEVTKGAIETDGGYLTDHGVEHIQTVIRRASDLVGANGCELTLYETYILLMAIHFHDVGNAFGRKEHEKAAQRAMDFIGASAGHDTIEKKEILRIARAHGGDVDGDKDTISHLDNEVTVLHQKVRSRLLAGIVRLADELADERDRASRFKLETGSLPDGALIFHAYALALHSVNVDHAASSVNLEFDFPIDTARKQYPYKGGQVYLLDYIFERTMKMYLETTYCMRFLRRCIDLDTVQVGIKIWGTALDPVAQVGYRLAQAGYPSATGDIHQLCPTLTSADGARITGASLAARLSEGTD